jgi:hypothetical protein
MPSFQEHLKKADGNAAFARSLSLTKQANIDWALIALFYAALHYVEAYLAKQTIHLRSHETRDKTVARDAQLKKTYKQYAHLKYFGFNARYEVFGFAAKNVNDEALADFEAARKNILEALQP